MKRSEPLHIAVFTLATLVVMMLPQWSFGQDDKKEIRSGTTRYEQGKYGDAELDFRKALEKSSGSYAGSYNLGSALYKQDKNEEAATRYAEAAQKATDPETKARALHNLGNAHVKSQKYQEAVDAYKQALKLQPSDNDTRYNLAYAQSMLKQQQQQQQNNQQQQNKDQNKNQQNQQKNQQDQQKQDQQKQDQQQGDQKKDQQQPKDGQARQQQPKISKEDAERILQALRNNEQELNKKLSKKEGVKGYVEKNW